MKESIHTYFQIGTIEWMSYPPERYPFLDSLKKLACDPFFTAVELTHIPDDGMRLKAREILEQSHMKVCYGAQPRLLGPGLNPNTLDEEKRMKAEKTLMEAVDEAEYLGAQGIAFLAGKWNPQTRMEAYAQLLKTTCSVCRYAAEKGMKAVSYTHLDVYKRQRHNRNRLLQRLVWRPGPEGHDWWPEVRDRFLISLIVPPVVN